VKTASPGGLISHGLNKKAKSKGMMWQISSPIPESSLKEGNLVTHPAREATKL
jgi:hypothetical protein